MDLKLDCFNRKKDSKGRQERKMIYTIYIIECYNDNERFIKLGFTRNRDVSKRFSKDFPYKWSVKYSCLCTNTEVIESTIHTLFNGLRYKPKIQFAGQTECYDNYLLETFIKILGSLKKNTKFKPKKTATHKQKSNNKKKQKFIPKKGIKQPKQERFRVLDNGNYKIHIAQTGRTYTEVDGRMVRVQRIK